MAVADLGLDYSGNGNYWTPNNFSVTAGVGNDSLVDTPTPYGADTGAGGEVRGNYCTLNPLSIGVGTLANGNLDWSTTTTDSAAVGSTMFLDSGKWYWEVTVNAGGALGVGLAKIGESLTSRLGTTANTYAYEQSGNKRTNNAISSYGATYTTGDVIGVALDMDAGTITFYKNNTSQGTAFSSLSGLYTPALSDYGTSTAAAASTNFGQRPFAYTAPSGFKALCTTNLPTPTIGATSTTQANDYFDVITYTGDGTNSRTITSSLGFTPDFAWGKSRSAALGHVLVDKVRGNYITLQSNTTGAETSINSYNLDTANSLITWNSNETNQNTATYVTWLWKANGAGSTNTSGTITSTVSANTTAGFSIVTYTGTGANATVGHGLGVAPKMIIVKNRTSGAASSDWFVYHASNTAAPETDYLELNSTVATADAITVWNDTAPTSTVFSLGSGIGTNENTSNFVAYCFAEVAGYSAFGSYTGNGSTDGPFCFTNHRPAFVLIKRTDTTSNWTILDLQREGYNVDNDPLFPNLVDAEGTTDLADLLSNGFKLRSTDASVNANTGTYIYMSLASNPFKYSLGR